ncbi:MAG: hypothetical protein J0L81_14915 [Caulobacterales bacterium]|jgi:hypothetical protein|nr:hypothetical protein [Caulobacterales bacterium]
MSSIVTASRRATQDHFEPEAALDPQEQRKLRGHLDQIDYTTFAANQAVIGKSLGQTDLEKFERLAIRAAHARAEWVAAALELSEKPHSLTAEETARLAALRTAYDELTEAYEALRRMVERGYLSYAPKK